MLQLSPEDFLGYTVFLNALPAIYRPGTIHLSPIESSHDSHNLTSALVNRESNIAARVIV
jgi:hypothetical protein